jgi:hypothetical protein
LVRVFPLIESNHGVRNCKQEREQFGSRLPTFERPILFSAGFIGTLWSWPRMGRGKDLPRRGTSLLLSRMAVAYGWCVILTRFVDRQRTRFNWVTLRVEEHGELFYSPDSLGRAMPDSQNS